MSAGAHCYGCNIELMEGQAVEVVWIGKYKQEEPQRKLLCAGCSNRIKPV